ncbi:MAG: methionyl-tRNA formyltransferase [Clostridia bacterium]|nr:methionyl-tRNA formyltransferase [Clostridia bacterium]
MRILFMGTPDFAKVCFESLLTTENEIIGVVTQPDKPKGRGYALMPPPVKVSALENNIPVYQPETLRDEAFATLLAELDPELIVVVAYGKILPKNVLDYPKFGCINVHGSLLPKYRGAAPIQRALIDGEKTTGITTMYMAEGLDTGDMIEMFEIAIRPEDNFETLHDKLADLGAYALMSTVKVIASGNVKRYKQDDSKSTYAKKIEKADCLVDFSKSAEEIHNLIRGTSPFPLSFAFLNGKMIKFTSSFLTEKTSKECAGKVVSLEKGNIYVATGNGVIGIDGVLPEGKGRMKASDFVNGRKIVEGDVFTSEK